MAERRGRIRRARPGEAAALTALALRSKAHWPYDQSLMEVFRRVLKITEQQIRAHHVLVHETGGVVDAVGVLAQFEGEWELDHLWVDPPAIGKGVGRRLLAAFLEEARRRGAGRVVLNADPHAEPFYLRMGAVKIGDHHVAEIPGRVLPRLALSLDDRG